MIDRAIALRVECMEDRLVPAMVIDLSTVDSFGTTPNGALVNQVDAQPTGTGFIRSFVRLQGAASGGGSEQGYNTTARPLQFDENSSPQFTRGLTLGKVPVVTVGGETYREFLLDINQKSSLATLSLDAVRVYLGDVSNLTGYDPITLKLAGLTAVYDLDGGGDVTVKLNARLNSGSGAGDMTLLIPTSFFGDAGPASFVYLYSQMGVVEGQKANGGFEEWAVKSTPGASGPGNSSLSGFVYIDPNQVLDGDETGIAGVVIQLQGTNIFGETVVMTAVTDANGFYKFSGLHEGKYSIFETQPAGFLDGADFVGSLGSGSIENDGFIDILLGPDQDGTGYIFTELRDE